MASLIDICCGCIGHSLGHITPGNRTGMIVAYNLFIQAVVTIGNGHMVGGRSGSTNAYHISRSGGVNLWWFWFGLPFFTRPPIWVRTGRGRPLPNITTANKGLTIGLGVEVTVGGWATVIRVDNVEDRRHTQKGSHGGGRCQKEKISEPGRSACKK